MYSSWDTDSSRHDFQLEAAMFAFIYSRAFKDCLLDVCDMARYKALMCQTQILPVYYKYFAFYYNSFELYGQNVMLVKIS